MVDDKGKTNIIHHTNDGKYFRQVKTGKLLILHYCIGVLRHSIYCSFYPDVEYLKESKDC